MKLPPARVRFPCPNCGAKIGLEFNMPDHLEVGQTAAVEGVKFDCPKCGDRLEFGGTTTRIPPPLGGVVTPN
jgi:predicted RNA-binding Zn-ribbon protein involved in translation (DUF1610 family)